MSAQNLRLIKCLLTEILCAISTDNAVEEIDQSQDLGRPFEQDMTKFSAMTPQQFKSIRLKLGLSQEEYGYKLGRISVRHIGRLENGHRRITERIAEEARQLEQSYKKAS